MKRSFAMLSLFICSCIICASCSKKSKDAANSNDNITPDGINFDEEFNDTTAPNAWVFTDSADSAYAIVTNGLYEYVNNSVTKSSSHLLYITPIGYKNFTARFRIKSNNTIGFVAGGSSPSYNGYGFYIDTEGNYSFWDEGNGTATAKLIIPPTLDTLAAKNDWNILELDHIDSDMTWVGLINSKQVFKVSAPPPIGTSCGFKVWSGTVGYADYVVLTGVLVRL